VTFRFLSAAADSYPRLRALIVQYMKRSMKDEIQNFLKSLAKNRSEAEEEENLSPTLSASVELAESEPVKAGLKYLSHMAKDESWGDFLCLMAAKRILGRHIHVFEMTRNECRKKKIDMRLLSDDPKSLLLLRVARKHSTQSFAVVQVIERELLLVGAFIPIQREKIASWSTMKSRMATACFEGCTWSLHTLRTTSTKTTKSVPRVSPQPTERQTSATSHWTKKGVKLRMNLFFFVWLVMMHERMREWKKEKKIEKIVCIMFGREGERI